ncbi:hypothetical protein Scep_018051 [Stephania cephalantha]|uniref:Ubiquitin-like protease family profile domain-containing protein n=1 Tax=Stephania cephalantha TaxID=152367 RepID=A0AAP0IS19_9MAGN
MGKRKSRKAEKTDSVDVSSRASDDDKPLSVIIRKTKEARRVGLVSTCLVDKFPRKKRCNKKATSKRKPVPKRPLELDLNVPISEVPQELDTDKPNTELLQELNLNIPISDLSPELDSNTPITEVPRELESNVLNSKLPQKLDSNVFQCYLENLWKKFSEEKRKSFTYVDCLWFALYRDQATKAKVLKWIKEKHIFSRKYVFVPIVCWDHWSLLILCHLGESSKSKTRPCMLLLDSLEMADPMRIEPDIRKFVLDIYKEEARAVENKFIERIPLLVPKVPQQRNENDCGIFVLYYISLFLESAPESFNISKGCPHFMNESWFNSESLESFCEEFHTFSRKMNSSSLQSSTLSTRTSGRTRVSRKVSLQNHSSCGNGTTHQKGGSKKLVNATGATKSNRRREKPNDVIEIEA